MFLYETKDIFDESGNGPKEGLVVKTLPDDMTPAKVGDTVMFLEESKAGVTLNDSFKIGEEKEEESEDENQEE